MMQIPRSALTKIMSFEAPDPDAEYGGEFLAPRTIEFVRFERKEALNPKAYALADGAQGRIWIDAVNSKGACEVPKGSKVVIGETRMQAVSCTPFEAMGRIHHWEVDVK